MNAFSVTHPSKSNKIVGLDKWKSAVIDLFLNAASSFGLPKSYGQIYGLLFCRDEQLSMDDVIGLLQIQQGVGQSGVTCLTSTWSNFF